MPLFFLVSLITRTGHYRVKLFLVVIVDFFSHKIDLWGFSAVTEWIFTVMDRWRLISYLASSTDIVWVILLVFIIESQTSLGFLWHHLNQLLLSLFYRYLALQSWSNTNRDGSWRANRFRELHVESRATLIHDMGINHPVRCREPSRRKHFLGFNSSAMV